LNDITITDGEAANAVISDLNAGTVPGIGFHGKFRRSDGLAERIIFRKGGIDLVPPMV
jgi:hypothetical protein